VPGLPGRLPLLPMRRREPFKIARGEIQLPGLRRVRPEPGRRHPRAALHPTRLSPAEVEALIAGYEGGAAP
jgi:hypothetical protein